jgi:aminopeptidase N
MPPRPARYADVAELFTATVYTKGAEIVRMIETVLGTGCIPHRGGAVLRPPRRAGGDVRGLPGSDGGGGRDRSRAFLRWYDTPGTPRVEARLTHDPAACRATLALSADMPLPIPLRVALFGADSGERLAERLVLFEGATEVVFDDVGERPVPSINRGFSAPVLWPQPHVADLAVLAMHEDDAFARHEAMQGLMIAGCERRRRSAQAISRIVVDVGSPRPRLTLARTRPGRGARGAADRRPRSREEWSSSIRR